LTVAEIVAGSRRRGFDGICLSEHDKIWPADEIARLSRELDFPIFRAMEVTTSEGHVLVFGLDEYRTAMHSLATLRKIADEAGAALIKSHPLRDMTPGREASSLAAYLAMFDGVEALSGGESAESNRQAFELARVHSIPAVGGGDVHSPSEIGRYATRFERRIADELMLAAEIRAGRIEPFAALP
jgi:hypothetical protein